MTYQPPAAPTFAGALSFLRTAYADDPAGADVAVLGVPFDLATSGRPGARFGPRGIRQASTPLAELAAYPWGFDVRDHLRITDLGDCLHDAGHPATLDDILTARVAGILGAGAWPLVLGGDHYITYGVLRAMAAAHGPLGLIHVDAHCDTWPDDGTQLDHGSMFLRALDEGLIDAGRTVQIGIRTHNEFDHGCTVVGAPWIHRHGTAATLQKVLDVVGDGPTYLTFDIDGLDPAFAPGTGTPVVGGLSTAQALELIRGLGPVDLVGADVVEVAPPYDHGEITSLAAATLAHDLLCLLAIRRGAPVRPTGLV